MITFFNLRDMAARARTSNDSGGRHSEVKLVAAAARSSGSPISQNHTNLSRVVLVKLNVAKAAGTAQVCRDVAKWVRIPLGSLLISKRKHPMHEGVNAQAHRKHAPRVSLVT